MRKERVSELGFGERVLRVNSPRRGGLTIVLKWNFLVNAWKRFLRG